MAPTIVFDVNETLLDLAPVRSWFTSRFGDEPDAAMWFGELLRLSFVSAATDQYAPFPELATSALATSAGRYGASIGDGDMSHIAGVLTTLPPHPDVTEGPRPPWWFRVQAHRTHQLTARDGQDAIGERGDCRSLRQHHVGGDGWPLQATSLGLRGRSGRARGNDV